MFDEDLTALYPSIIMSLNIGKETLVGRIIIPDEKVVVEGKEIFNCRFGLNDLKQMDGSDLLKKLRKAKRNDEKRIKELTEQLEGLTKSQRERTVKEVLEKKGVNPKAVRLILKDIDDVSEESVNNWLDDNGDLFGHKSH